MEWVDWTPQVAAERPDLVEAVERFQAPRQHPAGEAATGWLKEKALDAHRSTRTRLLVYEGAVQGYYSLAMSDVELRTSHRKEIRVEHPHQGAVLITWLARDENATLDDVFDHLMLHAVGTARRAAQEVPAAVIALDPYDEATADFWRERGFRNSLTQRDDAKPRRMWQVLFPD